jgi:hypothetical protein
MSIQEQFNKINPQNKKNGFNRELSDVETVSFNDNGEIQSKSILNRLFLPLVVILVMSIAFGLGRLSNQSKKASITIELDSSYSTTTGTYNGASKVEAKTAPTSEPATSSNEVVGSVKGTKYHYLYCPGAKQISSANKITFTNAAAAEAAGYTLALNCKPR